MIQYSPHTMTDHFTDYQFPLNMAQIMPPCDLWIQTQLSLIFLLASKNLPLKNKYFSVRVDRENCIQGYFCKQYHSVLNTTRLSFV